jgi:hypothetical protein
MPNTRDKHEDWDLIIHGASGLPRMLVFVEKGREERSGRRRRRKSG